MLTTGEGPPPADPLEPATPAGGFGTSMTWWTRAWVALFVAIAIGVVGGGVVIARRALDHSVDPKALLEVSTTRLAALDPSFPGMTAEPPDSSAIVDCEASLCASASRLFSVVPHTTAAAVMAAADAFARQWGLGTKGQAPATDIGCGGLSYAPTKASVCDLASYEVPGQTGQQVHVYAELAPGPGAGRQPGAYPVAAIGQVVVTDVYVQVITSVPLT
jgi:hypothetical protein